MLRPWSMVLLNFSSSCARTLKINSFFSSSSGYPSLDPSITVSLKLRQELALDTQQSSVAGGPADQTAQYIAPALVGRHDTVGNHECSGTDMVGDQTDGYILLFVFLVLRSEQARRPYPAVLCIVSTSKMESTSCTTTSQTLQTHTGIDIFLLQLGIVAVAVVLKLGKYVVPDLHVTVAVAAYGTARLAAAVFFSTVIVNLRTGAAGACTMLPEVVLFAKTENPVCWDADLLVPDIKRLVVLQINGRIQTVLDPVRLPLSGTPRTSGSLRVLK